MDDALREQIDSNLRHLDNLIQRGHQLLGSPTEAAIRAWQQDCAAAISQLSGGSKAHWLARSFSQAFLLRAPDGGVVEAAAPAEIVGRLVGVLEQGVASLSGMRDGGTVSAAAPSPRRFEFVHSSALRPVVEQAYAGSRLALEEGRYDAALLTSCGILEAIVTDALEHKGLACADWSFEARLAAAEQLGIIHGGCARLPAVARRYRDLGPENISEHDAKLAAQVLRVVMRDLDPGR